MNSLIALITISALVAAASAAPNSVVDTESNLELSGQTAEDDGKDSRIEEPNNNRTIVVVLGDVHIHNHSRPEDPVTTIKLKSALIVSLTKKATIADILRVVNGNEGKLLISAPDNSTELDEKLSEKGLFYIPLAEINGLDSLEGYRLYLNLAQLKIDLEELLKIGDFNGVSEISKVLYKQDDATLKSFFKDLLEKEPQTLAVVAYSLWKDGAKEIVNKCLPKYFEDILRGGNVTIINQAVPQALKLESDIDSAGDSVVKARVSKEESDRMPWVISPIEEVSNGRLRNIYFKVVSSGSKQCLKLGYSPDDSGDRQSFGAEGSCDSTSFYWILEPTVEEDELVFYMINRHYRQPLKLPAAQDANGDRLVFGHNDLDHYPAYKDESRFRWRIRSLA